MGVGRSKNNLKKWGVIQEDTKCDFGDEPTMSHLLICPKFPYKSHYLGSYKSDKGCNQSGETLGRENLTFSNQF